MKRLWLVSAIVCASVSWATSAHADAVTYWNAVTVEAVTAGRPGGAGFLDMALVHAAMHDAVQAIQQRFEPYAAKVKGSGSLEAAAGAAAYEVLVGIYPKQQDVFDAKYKGFLASGGLVGNAGLAVGQQAAAALLKHHRPATALPDYKGGSTPGAWRPTPSFVGSPAQPVAFAPMANLYLMETKPYTLERPSQFRAEAPPVLTSAAYLRDYNEVKALGARGSTTRTPAQTDLAYFWASNYVWQWNGALRSIVNADKMDLGDSARLFALANLAAADAAIALLGQQAALQLLASGYAIREAENDGNAETVADAAWEPLINTPNYPDYTSGAVTVTAAMTTTLAHFFGTDEFTFTVTTDVPQAKQKARTYKRFSEAAAEVVEARILLGIHFRFADVVARTQGTHVANWTFSHALRPVKN